MVKVVAFLVISGLIYSMLVAGDYLIARLGFGSSYNSPSAIIESIREIDEDLSQKKIAIAEDFIPIFYPVHLDENYSRLRKLAEKYSVAPLSPQPNTDVYYCNEGYGLLKYRTDRFGFRNKDSVWDRHADIVLIGDSYAHGACLANDYTIAGALETSLNVVNLATGGNHPIHYASIVKTFLPIIKPKYSVMVFYANDNQIFKDFKESYYYKYYFGENNSYFIDNKKLMLNPDLEHFYNEATTFILSSINNKNENFMSFFLEFEQLLQRASKYLSLPNIRSLIGAFTLNENELDLASQLAIDNLFLECQRLDCEPLIIYIPNSDFWRPDPRAKSYENALAKKASDYRISFWSASQEFSKVPNNEAYAIKGPHLSPLGNAIVAKGIKRLVSHD